MWLPIWTFKLHFKFTSIKTYSDKLLKTVISLTSFMLCLLTKIFWFYWDSQFLGRLIRSLGVPKERGVWNSQGRGKDKFFFFPLHSLPYHWLFSRVRLFVTPWTVSLPGSYVHGILQARILEWVAISFSKGFPQPRDRTWVSCIAGRCFILWATREAPTFLRII